VASIEAPFHQQMWPIKPPADAGEAACTACELFGAGGGRAHPAASVEASVASARCTQGRGRAVLLGGCKCSPSDGWGETPVWRVDVAARGGTGKPSRPLHGECTGTALLTDACRTTVPRGCARGRGAGMSLDEGRGGPPEYTSSGERGQGETRGTRQQEKDPFSHRVFHRPVDPPHCRGQPRSGLCALQTRPR